MEDLLHDAPVAACGQPDLEGAPGRGWCWVEEENQRMRRDENVMEQDKEGEGQ